jgi:hypothetical protein
MEQENENIVECASTGDMMPEDLARTLDEKMKEQPFDCKQLCRKSVVADDIQFEPGERAEVSIITTDRVDLSAEIILPKGIRLSHFNQTGRPVLWDHNTKLPQVGRCKWIKEQGNKIRAKTIYDERVTKSTSDPFWLDSIWDMILNGLLCAKSVAVLPDPQRGKREPTQEELDLNPTWKGCIVIEQSDLFEYSVCNIGVNPDALITAINTKSVSSEVLSGFGLTIPVDEKKKALDDLIEYVKKNAVPYTPKPKPVKKSPDYNKLLAEALNKIDFNTASIVNEVLSNYKNRGRA